MKHVTRMHVGESKKGGGGRGEMCAGPQHYTARHTTILISETRRNVHCDITYNLCNEMHTCNVICVKPEGIPCIKSDLNILY